MQPKTLAVTAIQNGTVVDHIAAGHALKIIRLLDLADDEKVVTVGLNFSSKALGKKDLIKVEKRELTPEEIGRVAILAPDATINIIRNYKVIKKFKAEIPEIVEYVIVCPNPKCVTNHEPVSSKFHVTRQKSDIRLQCHYCEKVFEEKEITNYKQN